MRQLVLLGAAASVVTAIFAISTKAEARCQGCLEGPMIVDTVPYYAPAYLVSYGPSYYAPRYYYPHRRYGRYAPHRYYVRHYAVRRYW